MKVSTLHKRVVFIMFFVSTLVMAGPKAFNIVDFGAIGDGKTDNTKIIQQVINEASKSGDGKVIIPEGTFLTGVLHLKSNVTLHLTKHAVLLGSAKRIDYGPEKASPLIVAKGQYHIAITGTGTIDGNGRELIKDIYKMLHAGTLEDHEWQQYNPWHQQRPAERNRPMMLYVYDCDDITVKDITLKNGLCWIQDFRNSSNIIIDNIKVKSTTFLNNDGIDLTDCKNARITNCFVDAADDGICLKSSTSNMLCENIYIANCKVRSSASAIKLGTASSGGFKNVTIENMEIYDTFRSAIAIESVDGGHIENINVSNINAVNTGNAIFIRLGHRSGESIGTAKNIHIKNIKVQVPLGRPDAGYEMSGPEVREAHNTFPSSIVGVPNHNIENVVIENVEISYPGLSQKEIAYVPLTHLMNVPERIQDYPEFSMFGELPAYGFYVRHVKGITFKNVKLTLENKDFRPAFIFDDVEGLEMNNIDTPTREKGQIILTNSTKTSVDKETKLLTEHL
ncbi:glycoside hydrolase family 28 protein [Wenyingzhuangia marina]|uniref:Parallel beta-helix repeat (Two copies) n=1 Tax=Wenyingzhuangia marina TaxID=1195760 RepID=A0A1M5UG56_9FLAO|nr:glycoside hydrolase family 28 protein [Wenyingzhuangia marina]SHH61898.1 parallel beta-helix repeat (two copies) [Wenyingzhuangia marina]